MACQIYGSRPIVLFMSLYMDSTPVVQQTSDDCKGRQRGRGVGGGGRGVGGCVGGVGGGGGGVLGGGGGVGIRTLLHLKIHSRFAKKRKRQDFECTVFYY